MGVCFICDTKLYGERTRVCSSITPHSNVSYPEKIAELIGDEAVVIVTPNDYICKKCNSLLTHMDKTENDLKLVKNAMLSYIQKKYGLLPPDHTFKDVNIVNGHLEAEDQLEQGQRKVSSGLTIGVSSTVTTAALVMPVQTPLKLLKTQQQPQQQQQQQPQQQQQQQPPTQQENTNKMKVYKCGFCTFQSKDLGHVRFHMRNHVNKKEPEKPILNQATDKELTPVPQQKRRIYRCQVCSKSFNCRIDCLDHIQKDHNQLTPSTSNAKRGTEDSCPVITKVMKPEPPKTQENNQQAESPMDVDKNQQGNIKGTVDMDMMLNDHVPSEGSADVEQKEETENSQEDKTVKEAKSEIKPEPAHEKATEEEEDTAALGQEEVDQETPDSIKKEYDEENENVENKTEDLDIESMLAAIHNDNPNNNEDTQNKA
ncbi:probable inactive protein kinase DDB_G0270444 [Metopolophium dirhodum]|uniref:probable inactive protein kinase DDB_G0270444 n=1 Tax=Metopolophium dirhodum TaxID=44670 RepID=UPI00298FDF60|nr:probable inactive protein kinase DDB_G0270444 [Metopolophium dirhodum]XP_060857366.1 probable inactive protein kinase DDB_G0270444 [Metopolophium dirhodum]